MDESVEVLDAVTLSRLATFECPPDYDDRHLSFSPDSRSLALFTSSKLVSWDIQTGGRLSEILPRPGERSPVVTSFTYSKDGKMVAVACKIWRTGNRIEYNVYTFDLPSRARLGPLLVPDGQLVCPIWTHDEYLRFAIIHPGSITIWELEFTLKHPPMQVESFPIPDEVVDGDNSLFLPALCRLSFTLDGTIQVWDVKASKLLLKSGGAFRLHEGHSFSSDGRFFASSTTSVDQVWKESPAGYALHPIPPSLSRYHQQLLSPNGRSMIFLLDGTINLWHTGDQTPSPPTPQIEDGLHSQNQILLSFSPNEKSAAFAQLHGNMVTILDLRSGELRLTIDTHMRVKCVGVAEGTVVVAGMDSIATWNLHGGDRASNASIDDRVRTVKLDGGLFKIPFISPDLSWVGGTVMESLRVYGVPTGKHLTTTTVFLGSHPRFTRDGREVWTSDRPENKGWEIIEGSVSGTKELKPLEKTLYPSRTFLWDSMRGYKVTDDGWVLSPTRKRLLWLPHRWRSDQEYKLWSGQFLGLTHRLLSEVVILEFLE